jgi:ubiquinone/menaquinone biosynthesis C-methylase UbiE
MPEHEEIYQQYAQQYDRLVMREDRQGNILPAIEKIIPLAGLDVVELGAGTGRLTALLAPRVRSIQALDISPAMLALARGKLLAAGLRNWHVEPADHRSLPLPDASAGLVISGWSLCYLVDWNRTAWRAEVEQALSEIWRILRPGGTVILLETQGTGFKTPHPPAHLLDYYAMLAEIGFASAWIRTDYRFKSRVEAEELSRFFFGEELAAQIAASGSPILPECTGLWWSKKSADTDGSRWRKPDAS